MTTQLVCTWTCDFCGDRRTSEILPPGWLYLVGPCGPIANACVRADCQAALRNQHTGTAESTLWQAWGRGG